jgi:hypothetical protein
MGRFLMRDSSSGAGSEGGSASTTTAATTITTTATATATIATTSGSNDNSSRLGTSDGLSAVPRNLLQRTADLSTVESASECEVTHSGSGAEDHDMRASLSLTGPGQPQESGEQTAAPFSFATDTERRRNLVEEQQMLPDSITGPADNRSRGHITYSLSPYPSVTHARRCHQNQDAVVILSLIFLH